MFSDDSLSIEEEERLIEKVAQKIIEYGLETPATLYLESWKPAIYFGGQLIRFFFVRSFLPYKEKEADKLIAVFEKRSNVEKLLLRIKELKK